MATKLRFPRLHHNGTVSYWSYQRQEWIENVFHVPIEELQHMHAYDQSRVKKHLQYLES